MTDRGRRSRRARPTGGKGGCEPRATIRDRERVALRMSSEGYTQVEIADRVGMTQGGVSQMLKRLDDRWLAEHLATAGRQLARFTRQREAIIKRAIIAFDESRGERVRQTRRTVRSQKSETVVKEVTAETSAGDPRFLETVRKAVADGMRAVDPKTGAAESTAFTLELNPLEPSTPAAPARHGAEWAEDDRDEDDER